MSVNHADRIREDLFVKGTWLNPAMVTRTKVELDGLTAPTMTATERTERAKVDPDFGRYQSGSETVNKDNNIFLEILLSTIDDKGTPRLRHARRVLEL